MRFFSYNNVIIKKSFKIRALNLMLDEKIYYKKSKILENGDLEIEIKTSYANKLKASLEKAGIEAEFSKNKGIISHLSRYKARIGFLIGSILLVIFVYISSNIIWEININGNSSVSDEQIISELKEVGISLGTYVPKIDYGKVQNRFLMNSDDISWISINIRGNVANISVRETLHENIQNDKKYTNVVAKTDGQIVLISVIDGKKQISIGDVVEKGQILISGVLDSQSQGVRYVNAKGSIKAYVNKEILVKIPYKDKVKAPTGNIGSDKSVKIFTNNIKIYNFNNKTENNYDIIEKSEQIKLFNLIKLPIFIETTTYYEYEYIDITRSSKEAVDLGLKELNARIEEATKDCELKSKEIKTYTDEEYFYIKCDLYCIEDIAEAVEFYVETK